MRLRASSRIAARRSWIRGRIRFGTRRRCSDLPWPACSPNGARAVGKECLDKKIPNFKSQIPIKSQMDKTGGAKAAAKRSLTTDAHGSRGAGRILQKET